MYPVFIDNLIGHAIPNKYGPFFSWLDNQNHFLYKEEDWQWNKIVCCVFVFAAGLFLEVSSPYVITFKGFLCELTVLVWILILRVFWVLVVLQISHENEAVWSTKFWFCSLFTIYFTKKFKIKNYFVWFYIIKSLFICATVYNKIAT